jgi:hypothetical protein
MFHASENYTHNPLIHRDRRLSKSTSEWVRSFACEDLKPLIVCRGPIRKEAMDVYTEMGINHFGILLSEKDSIVYPNALAPELRQLTDSRRVHRVPDYSGASKEERVERINQIISIAKDNNYDSIFAGYGFMAEDEEFVAAIESAGLKFIGPCAKTQARAGKKDEAKRTALSVNVSVTPGINNVTARTLLKKYPTRYNLVELVNAAGLSCDKTILEDTISLWRRWPIISSWPPMPKGSISSRSMNSVPRCRPRLPSSSASIRAAASGSRPSVVAAVRANVSSAAPSLPPRMPMKS